MANNNDLKVLHDAVVGREIPMEMEFDPKELTFQYTYKPYVDDKVKEVGYPESESSSESESPSESSSVQNSNPE